MTDDEWGRFVQAMSRLELALDQPQSKARINIFWDALRTTRIEAVEWAALEAEKKLVWFPKPKELSDLAAMAPLPRLPESEGEDVKLLVQIDPPEVQRNKLRELAETLNGSFGTSFKVADENGRVKLAGGGR